MSALKTTLIVTGVVVALAGVGTLGYMYYDERKQRKQLSDDLSSVLKQFEEVDTQIGEMKKLQTEGIILIDDQSPAAIALFDTLVAKQQERAEAKLKQASKEVKPVKGEGSVTYMKPEFAPAKDDQPEQPVKADVNSVEAVELREMPGLSQSDMLKGMVNTVIASRLVSLGMNEADADALMVKHEAAVSELADATGNSGADLSTIELASQEIERQFNLLQTTSKIFVAFVDEISVIAVHLRQSIASNG